MGNQRKRAARNMQLPQMTKFAEFADGTMEGKEDNDGKQLSQINGYELEFQWEDFRMAWFSRGDSHIFSVRGTCKKIDIGYDLFGKLKPPARLARLFKNLLRVLAKDEIKGKVSVVGHSLGGWIAYRLVSPLHLGRANLYRNSRYFEKMLMDDGDLNKDFMKVRSKITKNELVVDAHMFNPALWESVGLWSALSNPEWFYEVSEAKYKRFYFYKVQGDYVVKSTGTSCNRACFPDGKLKKADNQVSTRENKAVKLMWFPNFKLKGLNGLNAHSMKNFHRSTFVNGLNGPGLLQKKIYPDGFRMEPKEQINERIARKHPELVLNL